MASNGLIDRIARWNIDAKGDKALTDHFLSWGEFERLQQGDLSFIIGRKGTGKTAIARYLIGVTDDEKLCLTTNFVDVHAIFLQLKSRVRDPDPMSYLHQCYQAAVLLSGLNLLTQLVEFSDKYRKKYKRILRVARGQTLFRSLSSFITKIDLSIKRKNATIDLSARPTPSPTTDFAMIEDVIERCRRLYTEIGTPNLLLIDNIDETKIFYEPQYKQDAYTFLFSFVEAIYKWESDKDPFLQPIAMIRPEMLSRSGVPFQTKIVADAWELRWDREALSEMLAHRISKAARRETPDLANALSLFVSFSEITADEFIDVMFEHSLLRPRDTINLLQRLARRLKGSRRKVTLDRRFLDALLADHKTYLRLEVQDGLKLVTDDAELVIAWLKDKGRRPIERGEFSRQLSDHLAANGAKSKAEELMEHLFLSGAIGLNKHSGSGEFAYNSERRDLPKDCTLKVHLGIVDD